VTPVRWFLAALVLSTVAGAFLLPSLLPVDGPGVILTLSVPVLLCVFPLLVRARRRRVVGWVSTGALALGVVAGLLSIGVFFVPSLVLLAVGASRS
jgi:hypothetical protein